MQHPSSKEALFPLLSIILIGCAFFFLRFDWHLVVPTYTDWLLSVGDASTHFISWLFFKNEPWHFPPGAVHNYLAPLGTSVGLTDSLPLLALPLKLLAPILPFRFQYLGAWLLVNHILQALFGYLLLRTRTRNKIILFGGTLFFLLSPILLKKFKQIALDSHWLILAAFWIYFRTIPLDRRFANWLILLAVAALIHPYLTAMTAAIAITDFIRQALLEKNLSITKATLAIGCLFCVIIFQWYMAGYLIYTGMGPYQGAPASYENTSMNLNALFNAFDGHFNVTNRWQHAGYNYLGKGMLILSAVAIFVASRYKRLLPGKRNWPLLLLCILFLAYSVSNVITFNNIVLFRYTPPPPLRTLFSMFHTTGRFFWPVNYLIIFSVLLALDNISNQRLLFFLISTCVVVQFLDTRNLILRHDFFNQPFHNRLASPAWQQQMAGIKHIKAIPPLVRSLQDRDDYKGFALLAARYDKTIDIGYNARLPQEKAMEITRLLTNEVTVGPPDNQSLYVFGRQTFMKFQTLIHPSLECGRADGYIYCGMKTQEDFPSLRQ